MKKRRVTVREAELAVDPSITAIWVRLWSLAREDATTGCLLVDGHGASAYARVSVGVGEPVAAHGLAWIMTRGPAPPGLSVLHRCDRPRCVHPAHLFLGTARDNVHDMMRNGRMKPQALKRMPTCCRNGHDYSDSNVLPYGRWRRCRTCRTAADRRSTARRTERRRQGRAERNALHQNLQSNAPNA